MADRSDGVLLEVDGLAVSLGGRPVLDGVTFAVERASFTGLIGSNGSGKTTLLRAILGLQRTDRGFVRIDGAARRNARHGIGYVPQKVVIDPDAPLRARDFVSLGIDGERLGIPLPSRSRRARIDAMLAAVGAAHIADARLGTLSGGELQRVLIAHALIGGPRLLLLDEPLANLDIAASQEIVELLHRLSVDQQIAVVLSAHEMNVLLPYMDRVIYIASGKVVSGPTGEVIRADVLSELYGYHVDVLNVHGRVLVIAGSGEGEARPVVEPGTGHHFDVG